ncbi:dsDNA nuclease domain-containing protein [Zobellia nedashkovskayae]|uniref:dsDNA nuclease domain-containing protein n=1 Tax=Zobellia nedashkovskayae TaxID=2779510 RepID=UPI001889CBAA|nr:dsDNA nuclease domain-containing protein [Zobellia nedashkovskayae]
MSLIEKLRKVAPRENSGSISSNRFDYQKDWAICKLLELSVDKDFLLAFEFYEDIIVFDSSSSPNIIDFYQVKTKGKGKHSIATLLSKKKGSSILGKLFNNKLNFNEEANTLSIISNCDYKLNLETGENIGISVCCSELNKGEREKIAKELGKELNISWLKEYFDILFFEKSELTIEHHSDITQQKLNKYIESKYPNIKYNPTLAYSTIFDEVKRKNNIEKPISTFDELVKYKSFSKTDFDKMIQIVASEPNRLEKLKSEILNRLDSENAPMTFRRYFQKNWSNVEIEYLKTNNLLFTKIEKVIHKVIDDNETLLNNSLLNSMEKVLEIVMTNKPIKEQLIFDKDYIRIMILKDICDGE